jgi:hypothetical protein
MKGLKGHARQLDFGKRELKWIFKHGSDLVNLFLNREDGWEKSSDK